jgi:RNA polymerase sigma factor for flagellar operon FliA
MSSMKDDVQRALVLSLQGFSESFGVEEHVSSHEPAPRRSCCAASRSATCTTPSRSCRALRAVVEMYFFEDRPMAGIAELLGVSESRVSQMRSEALLLLKDGMNAQLAPELLPAQARPDGCAARRRDAYYAAVAGRGP